MIHNPATIAWGDHSEMQKAIDLLDAVKESIINAYVMKTGLSRARLSHLMDAETWMDANKAVELGFADSILFQKAEDGSGEDSGQSAGSADRDKDVSDPVMFSRRAVNNALVNKLERHYGKREKSVKEQTGISGNAGSRRDPENAFRKCEKKKVNEAVNGRSADELRERLDFIKKFI